MRTEDDESAQPREIVVSKLNDKICELLCRSVELETVKPERTLQDSARSVLNRKVRVTEGHKTRRVTLLEAILTKNLAEAARDPRKLKLVLRVADSHERLSISAPMLETLTRIKAQTFSKPLLAMRELIKESEGWADDEDAHHDG